jgi:hypothetical protein
MTEPNYKKMYSELQERASELGRQRTDLELQLGEIVTQLKNLNQTLNHLAPLAGRVADPFEDSDLENMGITDAVREVLNPDVKLSVNDVKEKMEKRGFDFSKYSAPGASVRTVLNRLVDAKPPQAVIEKEGYKTFYSGVAGPEITDEDIPF